MKNIKWKIKYPCQLGILFIVVSLIYLVLILQIVNSQKIAWGVEAANFNLGGLNPQIAQEKLKDRWDSFNNQELTFFYQEESWSAKLADLGFQIDEQAIISQAYQIGRKSNIFINLKEQLAALIGFYKLEPVYKINQEKFQEQTNQLFKDIERPAQNASLFFDQQANDFLLQHSSQGITVNREKLLADLTEQIKSLANQPINLELVFDYPSIKNNKVDSARQKAQQILDNQPYQLSFQGRVWFIDKKTLIDWIKFDPFSNGTDNQILGLFLDKNKIKDHLAKIAVAINQRRINAKIETEGKRAVIFYSNQTGFQVKTEETISRLIANILAEPPVKKTNIIVIETPAKIILEQTNDLGINSLLGQGTSNFAGSSKSRIHNIELGAAKFDGLILEPGEEFSFNNLLGGSGSEEGFLEELVIKKDKTVPEYGGGLCQVSTTLFRAAVNTGLEITERVNHAFPVEYYYPQGFDATVYEPSPDLRFINNTPAHLLIQAIIKGNQLTFNFYGTDDGRQVKITGPYVLESKEDGSMKTVLTQAIYKNGELSSENSFYSNYQSPDLYPREDNSSE